MPQSFLEGSCRTLFYGALTGILGLTACSGGDSSTQTDSGSEATADAGTTTSDGGPAEGDGGESVADAGHPLERRNTGFISIYQAQEHGGWIRDAFAGFLRVPDEEEDPCREQASEASCVFRVCDIGPGSGGEVEIASAGTVRIEGGPIDVSLEPGGDDPYHKQSNGSSPWWTSPLDLSVTAEGADVPAFTTNVQTPSSLVLTAPELLVSSDVDDTGATVEFVTLDVDPSKDLPLAWTAEGAAGRLTFEIRQAVSAVTVQGVRCELDVGAAGATVPTALLSRLDDSLETDFRMDTRTRSDHDAGDWPVQIVATTPAHAPTGHEAAGGIVFNGGE